MSLYEDIKTVLVNEGANNEQGWHSWRCFDKDRYPEPCGCTDAVVQEILDLITSRINDYYRVAPKAAEPLMRALDNGDTG